jgi:hypothetical protein
MSVEFVNGVSQELIPYLKTFWGNRQDTVIHLEGLEGPPHGIPLPNFPGDAQWASQRPFITNVMRWRADPDGSNDDTKFVTGITAVIEECFDPRGRLIITGKSSGGVNALQLCRHLAKHCGFFRIRKLSNPIFDNEPKGQFFATLPDSTVFTVKVRIDLICIFDASFDTDGFVRQRVIPSMVRTYANWFQTKDKDTQVHTTLSPVDASMTRRIMERNCNSEIPSFERSPHVFVCKNLGPREATPMIENEINAPMPLITPNLLNLPTPKLGPDLRVRK